MNNKLFRVLLGVIASAMFASTASASLLVNGGFEDTPIAGAEEQGGGTGWSTYGAAFRVQQTGGGCDPISCVGAYEGTVALKVFGDAGVFQDFDATEGDMFDGGVWAINPLNGDQMSGGQIGLAALIFLDAGGNVISDVTSNVLTSASTVDEWIELTLAGVAPAGTATARFQVFTTGGGGGAPRFDGAYLNRTAVPVPAAVWLLGSGMLGLMAARRKKAA